jgi:hypothetical protein
MSGPFDPAQCGGCGAPVWYGEDQATGDRIPLEPQPEMLGEDRYTVVKDRPGEPHLVRSVMPQSEIQAYRDHRVDCPVLP